MNFDSTKYLTLKNFVPMQTSTPYTRMKPQKFHQNSNNDNFL